MSESQKVQPYNSNLTVVDCEDNIIRLFIQYKNVPLENVAKRGEIMSNIDSWLDTRAMLVTLNEKGGVTVGG